MIYIKKVAICMFNTATKASELYILDSKKNRKKKERKAPWG